MAKKATEAAFSSYAEKYAQYKPRMKWAQEFRAEAAFSVKGFELKGVIDVGEREVSLDLDVPFVLRPFKAKALEVIERELRIWVAKAKAGELG